LKDGNNEKCGLEARFEDSFPKLLVEKELHKGFVW
jgi:hypothetical protein